jgi:hypothetical protein
MKIMMPNGITGLEGVKYNDLHFENSTTAERNI